MEAADFSGSVWEDEAWRGLGAGGRVWMDLEEGGCLAAWAALQICTEGLEGQRRR